MPEQTKKSEPRAATEAPKKWPKLLNLDEVAEALDISRTAVKRLIAGGKLPSLKIGGARKVAQHDLWVFFQTARKLGTQAPELARVEEPSPRPTAEERTLPLPHTERASA